MDFIISNKLKKVLEESSEKSVIAADLLKVKTVEECKEWINYLCIAEDDVSKISYLNKSRYENNLKDMQKPELTPGTKVILQRDIEFGVKFNHWCEPIEHKIFKKGEEVYYIQTHPDVELSAINEKYTGKWCVQSDYNHWDFKKSDRTWDSSFRYMASCGKIITKIFGNKYGGKDMAKFCEIFSSVHPYNNIHLEYDTEFVQGVDIRKYYLENNYTECSGQLGFSCMRYDECQKYMDIYVLNDKQISMFIVKPKGEDTINARVIVWENKYFDRIYATDDKLSASVCRYLEGLGLIQIYKSDIEYEIELDFADFDTYPYMDSLRYLSGNILSTSCGDICLDSDDGNPQNCNWSEYHGEHIPEDESVYVESRHDYFYEHECSTDIDDNWVFDNDVIDLINGEITYDGNPTLVCLYDGGYALRGYSAFDIVELHDGEYACKNHHNVVQLYNDEYAIEGDCVKSEYHGGWILEEDAEEIGGDYILTDSIEEYKQQLIDA